MYTETNNKQLVPGAIVLSMCSQTQISSIAAWFNRHGANAGVEASSFMQDDDAVQIPRMLAFLDGRGGLSKKEMRAVTFAFYMDILTMLKVPRDQDYYRDQLKAVFNLSDAYADKIADSIETVDVVEGLWDKMTEWAKNAANKLTFGALDLDNTQRYDTDALYERYLYGLAIIEMFRRVKIMGAGAISLYETMPSIAAETGDPEEVFGDVTSALIASRDVPYTDNEMGFAFIPLAMAAMSGKRRAATLKTASAVGKKALGVLKKKRKKRH